MSLRGSIYEAVDDRHDELVAFLQSLVRFETENPPGRNYRPAAEFLADALESRGYDTHRIEVPPGVVAEHYPGRHDHERVNVIGRKGAGDGPAVHFTGHFDVVPAGEGWTHDPFDPVVRDGRIYGRGTSDMKSGLAASVFAVDALEAAGVPIRGSITQSMTVDEETGGFTGLGYLVEAGYLAPANTDYCVYTECFDASRICLGHRGVLKFRVVAAGEQAHGCMAHDGTNAIMAMHAFLSHVEEYRARLHDRTTTQPVIPEESRRADIAVTMTDAGYSENVVPDRCEATFYRVLVPGETAADAREEVRALIETAADETGAPFEYEEIMYAEPAMVPADGVLARAYTDAILDFHASTEPVVSPGSDDQRFVVNDAGIEECIVYGPGLLEQAHVADEYVPVDGLVTATKVMAVATAGLLGAAV